MCIFSGQVAHVGGTKIFARHLHQSKIGEQLYGAPMLMEKSVEETEYQESTATMLGHFLPKTGNTFASDTSTILVIPEMIIHHERSVLGFRNSAEWSQAASARKATGLGLAGTVGKADCLGHLRFSLWRCLVFAVGNGQGQSVIRQQESAAIP